MRPLAPVALSSLVVVGCSNCASTTGAKPQAPPPPDTSKIVKVIGRWAMASACPIDSRIALTAAHVVDPRPFDKAVPYSSLIWQQGGRGGIFTVLEMPDLEGKPEPQVSRVRDLAVITTGQDLEFYPVAKVVPQAGAVLYLTGYDWRDRPRAFADRVWKVRLIRAVAGILVYEPAGEPGTSGSCVLNEGGEVVGINTGSVLVGARSSLSLSGLQQEVGIGVVVVGLF